MEQAIQIHGIPQGPSEQGQDQGGGDRDGRGPRTPDRPRQATGRSQQNHGDQRPLVGRQDGHVVVKGPPEAMLGVLAPPVGDRLPDDAEEAQRP